MNEKKTVLAVTVELTVSGIYEDPVTSWEVRIDKDLPFSLWTELLDSLGQAVLAFDKEKFGGLYENKGVQVSPSLDRYAQN